MVFSFTPSLTSPSSPLVTLIGALISMTGSQHQVTVFILVAIWFHGCLGNKRLSLEVALKHNTTAALADITWLQSLFTELRLPGSFPQIYCDNVEVVLLASNPVLHSKTKHFELDLFFCARSCSTTTPLCCSSSFSIPNC